MIHEPREEVVELAFFQIQKWIWNWKQRSTNDHLVRLESFVREAFAQRSAGVFFDMEKAYESTWKFGIMRDLCSPRCW